MENAALYATSNQLQRRDAAIALAANLPAMTWVEGERVLDIGSGSGDVTSNLLAPAIPVSCNLVGVDCSREMVEFANESFGSETVSFAEMDIERIQHPRDIFPAGFDKIFSLYCLHWIKDLPAAVRNIHELLVDGGQALVVFLSSNPIFRMYRILAKNIKWASFMLDVEQYIPVYQDKTDPAAEFRSLLSRTGFYIRKCEAVQFSFKFNNQNQLMAAVKAVNPFLSRIPKERQTEYLVDCMTTLAKLDTDPRQDKMEARYCLLVAHMRK